MIWADLAFALAALGLGAWISLRRPQQVGDVRFVFALGFDRPLDEATPATHECGAASPGLPAVPLPEALLAPAAVAAVADVTPSTEADVAILATCAAVTSAEVSPAQAHARGRWWPFGRRAAPPEIIPLLENTDESVVERQPADFAAVQVPEPERSLVVEDRPAPAVTNALPDVAAELAEDDVPQLSDELGLTDERRRELSAAAEQSSAATSPNPAPADIDDSLAASRAALEAAQRHASAWACEITGATAPLSVERRRKLLTFYLTALPGESETLSLLRRIVDEDPDLRPTAVATLAESAA